MIDRVEHSLARLSSLRADTRTILQFEKGGGDQVKFAARGSSTCRRNRSIPTAPITAGP